MILSARLLVLLSVVGGFFLAYRAEQDPDILRLAICASFYVGVVLPLVWLHLRSGDGPISRSDHS